MIHQPKPDPGAAEGEDGGFELLLECGELGGELGALRFGESGVLGRGEGGLGCDELSAEVSLLLGRSIGPTGSTIAGRSTLAAAIS